MRSYPCEECLGVWEGGGEGGDEGMGIRVVTLWRGKAVVIHTRKRGVNILRLI